jgi:hypothetical protein
MNPVRIRPRSSIADPELARSAVVDLPAAPAVGRLHTPRTLLAAIASLRGAGAEELERVIVLSLVPVATRRR